jgi:16S rRNA (uracil1498-N3)-methyltransferase
MQEGAACLLFDQEGNEFSGRIKRFLPNGWCEAVLIERMSRPAGSRLALSVAQAIPKNRKMERVVEKSAELGISELIPIITERTAVRLSSEHKKKVNERWIRIRDQALKQSRVVRPPRIAEVTLFQDLWAVSTQYDHIFVLHPSSEAQPIGGLVRLKDEISGAKPPVRILLVIGPEGGFSQAELDQASSCRAQLIRLGSGILKTDTAFVAAASFFLFAFDNQNGPEDGS